MSESQTLETLTTSCGERWKMMLRHNAGGSEHHGGVSCSMVVSNEV